MLDVDRPTGWLQVTADGLKRHRPCEPVFGSGRGPACRSSRRVPFASAGRVTPFLEVICGGSWFCQVVADQR
jgi:hypothetical protein